jgi:hypothetical protein
MVAHQSGIYPPVAHKKKHLTMTERCFPVSGGDEGIRTLDPCLAKAVLSQLSHIPTSFLVVGSAD